MSTAHPATDEQPHEQAIAFSLISFLLTSFAAVGMYLTNWGWDGAPSITQSASADSSAWVAISQAFWMGAISGGIGACLAYLIVVRPYRVRRLWWLLVVVIVSAISLAILAGILWTPTSVD